MDSRCKLFCFLIITFGSSVLCDECVTFDFESDFNTSFSNEFGVCVGRQMWGLGYYEDLPIDSPNPSSLQYVYPRAALSCVSSFPFTMSASGILEMNLYMDPSAPTDQVTILAHQIVENGNDAVVGNLWIIAMEDNFVQGWRTARIRLTGFGTYAGYISILGMAAEESIVLVDSFRFVPPNIPDEECLIYEGDETSTAVPTTTETLSTTDIITVIPTETPTDVPTEILTESTTVSETETTTGIPAETTTVAPTDVPIETTTAAPVETTTDVPIETTTAAPVETTTDVPIETTTAAPVETTTDVPIETTTAAPVETTTDVPIETTTAAPAETTTDVPIETTTAAPAETTTDVPTESTTVAPTEATTDIPIETTTVIQTETATFTPTETPAITPTIITQPAFTTQPEPEPIPEKTTTASDPIDDVTEVSTTTQNGETNSTINDGTDTTSVPDVTDPGSDNETERPILNPDKSGFWNPFTITMVVFLLLIFLILTAIISYYIGKARSRRDSQVTLSDFDVPNPIKIPRVSKVWKEPKFWSK